MSERITNSTSAHNKATGESRVGRSAAEMLSNGEVRTIFVERSGQPPVVLQYWESSPAREQMARTAAHRAYRASSEGTAAYREARQGLN
jgi:hypothetical protein